MTNTKKLKILGVFQDFQEMVTITQIIMNVQSIRQAEISVSNTKNVETLTTMINGMITTINDPN
jgi:uncharacterized membrane protein